MKPEHKLRRIHMATCHDAESLFLIGVQSAVKNVLPITADVNRLVLFRQAHQPLGITSLVECRRDGMCGMAGEDQCSTTHRVARVRARHRSSDVHGVEVAESRRHDALVACSTQHVAAPVRATRHGAQGRIGIDVPDDVSKMNAMLDDKFKRTIRLNARVGLQDVGLAVEVVLLVKFRRIQGLIYTATNFQQSILLKGPAIGV